jgi:hypothetical protein
MDPQIPDIQGIAEKIYEKLDSESVKNNGEK